MQTLGYLAGKARALKAPELSDRKFITVFVSELYVILIGLAIAELIYRGELDLAQPYKIIMAIFVLLMVSLYWWDWAAYVEQSFVASRSEFALDFTVLILLVLLFRHFDQPVSLAGNFLALGGVDLVWALNHIREHPQQTFCRRRDWLVQKSLGLLIYGLALAVVLCGRRWGWPEVGLASVVVVSALVVRFVCFRAVRRRDMMRLDRAGAGDVERIVALNQQYVNNGLSDAFLLETLTASTVETLLSSEPPRLYVGRRAGRVTAYTKVSDAIDPQVLADLKWFDPDLEALVRDRSLLHVEQVAVDPPDRNAGLGKRLYEKLLQLHPQATACAFVSLRPRCNSTSLRFHAALGFQKAAVFERDVFLGEKGYRSVLLVRPPKGWVAN
jgi:GNAT superfamily N-acetyltransferase